MSNSKITVFAYADNTAPIDQGKAPPVPLVSIIGNRDNCCGYSESIGFTPAEARRVSVNLMLAADAAEGGADFEKDI